MGRKLLILVVAGLSLAGCSSAAPVMSPPPATAEGESPELLLPLQQQWTGDLDGIKARRLLRIIVPYSKTTYFLDGAKQLGTAVDIGHELERWLAERHRFDPKALRITVTFIPTPRERLLTALTEGHGDLVSGNLTITKERLKKVDFSIPILTDVKEIVVTGPSGPDPHSIEDLAGQEVYLRKSSSYAEHLASLNKRLKKAGKPPIKIKPADENLEDEDILEMVNAGILPLAIVDDHIARFWAQVFDDIRLHEDVLVNEGGDIAWAVRKHCPQLLAEINEFIRTHSVDSAFGKEVLRKYLRSTKYVLNPTATEDLRRFSELIGFFRRYGSRYNFDTLMLVALGYQESRLDQRARSPAGAVGVMQILPSTAAMPAINIRGVERDAERNIHAATKYLRLLVEEYLDDPGIDAKNRTLMIFAAYNAGPGNLNRFRDFARKSGLDPNVWFDNVELGAARIVGRETVQYVSNIYKYYIAYKLVVERKGDRAESIKMMGRPK